MSAHKPAGMYHPIPDKGAVTTVILAEVSSQISQSPSDCTCSYSVTIFEHFNHTILSNNFLTLHPTQSLSGNSKAFGLTFVVFLGTLHNKAILYMSPGPLVKLFAQVDDFIFVLFNPLIHF